MATATLVDQEIQDGKRLIDALNQAGLSVNKVNYDYLISGEEFDRQLK